MKPANRPDELARRRGLARVGPVTVGVAVLGSAATVTVAVGLAVSRAPHAATRVPIFPVPATNSTAPGPAAVAPGEDDGEGGRSSARSQHKPAPVAPATQAPPAATSQGS